MGLIKLYGARDSLEAHHLRATLEDEGIPATVMGESLGAARGEIPVTVETLPSVWVDESDAESALAVVRDFLDGEDEDAPWAETQPAREWTCLNCHERIEPQFAQCWNCGADRPDWM